MSFTWKNGYKNHPKRESKKRKEQNADIGSLKLGELFSIFTKREDFPLDILACGSICACLLYEKQKHNMFTVKMN